MSEEKPPELTTSQKGLLYLATLFLKIVVVFLGILTIGVIGKSLETPLEVQKVVSILLVAYIALRY